MKKHRIHILLVEDESAHAHLILRAFEPFLERYQVTVVDSLHHANICLDESSPDIILTDLLLPDGKGTTLVSCREPDKNIPVVVMTSHGDEQIAVKAIKAGALDYVVKSEITLLDMPHIVERTLREWALILEQQHTHKTLQESEKRFRILFEQAADSVVLIKPETQTIIDFNDLAHHNLGFSREEFQHLSIRELEISESSHEVSRHLDNIGQEKERTFETKLRTKTGKIRDILMNSRAVAFGGKDYVMGIWHDITERKQMEDQLEAALDEKETLIKEVYHRTKNNMNVIHSLLSLQSARIEDERAIHIFRETISRVQAMALVHEKLYRSHDLANIDLKEYLADLASSVFTNYQSFSGNVSLLFDLDHIIVSTKTAIPCGLILNELLTNSLKYAFPEEKTGEIQVILHSINDGDIELQVQDNGIGIPEGVDIRKTDSLGLQLVISLAERQLQGQVELKKACGADFSIRFKPR